MKIAPAARQSIAMGTAYSIEQKTCAQLYRQVQIPTPDRRGCPLPDRDGDGVLDPCRSVPPTWPQVPSPIRRESAARLPIAMATACWMPAISARRSARRSS